MFEVVTSPEEYDSFCMMTPDVTIGLLRLWSLTLNLLLLIASILLLDMLASVCELVGILEIMWLLF